MLCALVLGALLVIHATPARADNVAELVKQLDSGSDYKVRLSAALSLSKLADPRAIPAFIDALEDSDKTVRGAAAVGLSKLITAKTKDAVRSKAVDALTRVAKNDASSFVQKQAQKALDTIAALGGGSTGGAVAPFYVNIGDMAVKPSGVDALKALMRTTAEKILRKTDKNMATTWAGGGVPTQKQLDGAKVGGFFIDGTLNDITVKTKGSSTIVSCKLSMLVATFPRKSIFGVLEGSASVQGSDDPKDIEFAKGDCVAAVVEDLVAKKIVPTIQTRTGNP